jgi:RNA polymerase sigma factor (sigma-70 family)
VRQAAEGSATAWNSLVERFTPVIWNICLRHRLDKHDAADVCQNVWLRLTERLDTIRSPDALAGWLATTARHECLATLRRQRGSVPTAAADVDLADDPQRTDPDRNLLQAERHQALLAALGELPTSGRSLLLLLMDDPPRSYREISEILQMPIGSIGPMRSRYLDRLRQSPALAGFTPSASPAAIGGSR